MKTISALPRRNAGTPPAAFRLPLSPRVPLVKIDTVIAARGESADVIRAHIEKGKLRWIFNLAAPKTAIRDLRFWNREISAFACAERSALDAVATTNNRAVVKEILGESQTFRPGEVCLLLGISRPTLMQLRRELRAGHGDTVSRKALEQFLTRRLL